MSIRDCRQIQPKLSEYVDGMLSDEETWRTRKHLATCAVCSRVAEELSTTVRLLQSLPLGEPSGRFEEKLAQRLADVVLVPRPATLMERIALWWNQPRVRPAVLTSSLALVALLPLGIVSLNRTRVMRPQPPVVRMPAPESTVDQLWREHISSASEEPLGDPSAGLVVASAERGGAGL